MPVSRVRFLPRCVLRSLTPQLHHDKHHGIRTDTEQCGDSNVSPPVTFLIKVQSLRIVGSSCVRAVFAARWAHRINHVPCVLSQELAHIFPAGTVCRQRNSRKFILSAMHLNVPYNFRQETSNKVGEWVEPVDPKAPERWDLRIWHDDAAEGDQTGADYYGVQERREVLVGRVSGDGLADGGVEKLIHYEIVSQSPQLGVKMPERSGHTYHLKVELAGYRSLKREASREVRADKVDGATDDEPWDLGDALAEDKSRPVVHFRLWKM